MRFRGLRNLDRDICAVIFAAMMVLVVIQIVMRVVFLAPVVGAEELVRYFLICIIFLGAPYAARNGGHIRMEEFQSMLPKPLRSAVRFLSLFFSVAVFGVISFAALLSLAQNLKNSTATLSMPYWLFILPTVLGFVLLTVEYALIFAGSLRGAAGRAETK
jgi:TRAP-type C4-dicarboxylate transport system permease small subunit